MPRILTLSALTLLAACQVSDEQGGRAIFAENCASCHGDSGKGDGPAASGLNAALPDLTTIAARNGGSFPWARVMTQIDGYTRRGPREIMPEFGEGFTGETVPFDSGDGIQTPTPKPLIELATYLESLQE